MGILQRTERSIVRAVCGVQLKDRKRSKDFMLMLGMNETIDQLAMANSVHWYGHVLRREDDHIVRRALGLKVEGQKKKRRLKKTRKKQDEEDSEKAEMRRGDTVCRSKWCLCHCY